MAHGRITVTLKLEEKTALSKLAKCERRDPRQQAAYIIRQALESAGLLAPPQLANEQISPQGLILKPE